MEKTSGLEVNNVLNIFLARWDRAAEKEPKTKYEVVWTGKLALEEGCVLYINLFAASLVIDFCRKKDLLTVVIFLFFIKIVFIKKWKLYSAITRPTSWFINPSLLRSRGIKPQVAGS